MRVSKETALRIGKKLKVNFEKIRLNEFKMGIGIELEHKSITRGSLTKSGRIALDHLKEIPDYYTRLKKMERRR